jgi:site-specific recombinase XerD
MDNLQIRFVFDRKKQATNVQKGLLQIEVRVQRTSKKVFISTGIRLYKNQFSDRNGFTCRNHDNASLITGKATRTFRQIEAFCLSDKCKSIEDVKKWDKDEACTYSVVEFIKSELIKNNPSLAVVEYHNSLIRRIEEFGKIKTFNDITYANIVDFDRHLRLTIKSQPTLYKRHSALHRYILDAINRGLCSFDPYLQFKIQKGKSKDPVFLEEWEIRKIQEYIPINEKIGHVKNLFIFQCFTGLSFIDLSKFDSSYISVVDGKKIIRSNRQKTDESFISLLLPEAESILNKYTYKLPKISNQKYNDYLKLLGTGSGITKNLTSHVARHTFATYLLNKNIPIETVSRAMGHSNIKMTQHYAKMLGKKVIADMEILL